MTEEEDRTVKIVQGLFLLNASIWAAFGAISMARMSVDGTTQSPLLGAIATMLFGNSIVMGLSAWLIGKREIWGYIFALAIVIVNIFLTFTDQVGFFDIATVVLDVVLLGILLVKRKAIYQSGEANPS
jgi:hypothetical protein